MNMVTGEVKECKKSEHRGESTQSVKRSLRKLRSIINNNFTGKPNELMVTLTYAENMTDQKRLYKDVEKFIKKLRYHYKDAEYICVVEPQGRGAWHCHMLIKFISREKIYIGNNDEVSPMWGHGFTKTTRITEVDNIGAYLTAYLSDIEVTENNHDVIISCLNNHTEEIEKEITQNGKKQKKRFIKGGRLNMYPPGMNLYRCSRGIIKPKVEKMTYANVKKIVGSEPPNYLKQIVMQNDK